MKQKKKAHKEQRNKKSMPSKNGIYIVLKVSGNVAVLTPEVSNAKKQLRMKVHTSISVAPGQKVRVGFVTARQSVMDALCLAVPLLCATGACLLLPQSLKAAGVAAACIISSGITSRLTRKCSSSRGGNDSRNDTLQITKVIQ